ncbi:MAG: OmpH family outer membrane protein [Deltaproteobacteria bacterium]|nr:OmpH family outer membrane protein [Deltaproteobacteria bacterium]
MEKVSYFKLPLIFLTVSIVVLTTGTGNGAKGDKDKSISVITEAELQSHLMSFADRFTSIISTAAHKYDALSPPPESRLPVMGSAIYARAAAYIIAAESDPDVALLDMAVMVTLGRMIYEEHWQKKFGNQVEPVINGFRKAEEDIWQIVNEVLTIDHQRELHALILEWYQNHPDMYVFYNIRFSNFSAERRKSKLSKKQKESGLVKSVDAATQQVEEIRLQAERGMFLATRLPMMTGAFTDIWYSRLATNPDFNRILNNIDQLSEVSERLADVAEKLPDHVAKERDKTIKQAMKNISAERQAAIKQFMMDLSTERKKAIQEFLDEEQRMRGLLAELRQTLTAGSELVTSVNTLAERLDLGHSETDAASSSEPFNIKDYQATLVEASNVIQKLDSLTKTIERVIDSPGFKQLEPIFDKSVGRVEKEGEKIIDHTFRRTVLLILICLFAYIGARLAYDYLAGKLPLRDRK